MPELPEVEIVARSLDSLITNRQIRASELLRERLAPETTPEVFSRRIDGSKVNFVHRRGKHILFDLDNGHTLIIHLRMSGQFMLLPEESIYPKFTHAVFHFNCGSRLIFHDQRHFGLMKITPTANLYEAKELEKLAPEPFSIYASEAMFMAGVDPRKSANSLSRKRAADLRIQIIEVLREAVEMGTSAPSDPVNIGEGVYGNGSETYWRVYGRETQPCPKCDTPILRIKQGGRSTYFCTKCQK
jgi:formamidopyrimidine-DNA glycosylase